MSDIIGRLGKNLFGDNPDIEARIKNGIELYRKGAAKITVKDAAGNPVEHAEIEFRMTKHEYDFGCNAFFYRQFGDDARNAAYEKAFAGLFNLAVVPFYWDATEPEEGKLRYDKGSPKFHRRPATDELLEFCKENRIKPKGHPLFWHQFLPSWLRPEGAAEKLERRIAGIAARYGHQIKNWDVVNEALSLHTQEDRVPQNHVELAFEMAKKHFPSFSTFNYNEIPHYSWNTFTRGYSPLYLLTKHLIDKGLKVDGLGLQYHLFGCLPEKMADCWADYYLDPRRLYDNMDQYQKLGIPFNISEITVTAHQGLGPQAFDFQAAAVERLYKIWFSHPGSNGIIYWNLVDNTAHENKKDATWNENVYLGGLLNNDTSPKPSYLALENLIKKEWVSDGTIAYDAAKSNYFRGFFGEYDVVVKTDAGEFHRKMSLMKNKYNEQVFTA